MWTTVGVRQELSGWALSLTKNHAVPHGFTSCIAKVYQRFQLSVVLVPLYVVFANSSATSYFILGQLY